MIHQSTLREKEGKEEALALQIRSKTKTPSHNVYRKSFVCGLYITIGRLIVLLTESQISSSWA